MKDFLKDESSFAGNFFKTLETELSFVIIGVPEC